MSQVLVMVKPWVVAQAEHIFSQLDRGAAREKPSVFIPSLDEHTIRSLYEAYKGTDILEGIVEDMVLLPVHIAVYEGSQVFFNAQKEVIRYAYDVFIPKISTHQRNALHISDSHEAFNREYNLFKKFLQ